MSFDDIPEDSELSFPCPNDCGGNVTEHDNGKGKYWECDNCDWKSFEDNE